MVPEIECDGVKRLLAKLNCESAPILVKCIPEANAQLNDCFPLVENKIKHHGGLFVLGWEIRKTKLLVEAIFHAVWKSKDEKLIDISPKPVPTREIMFVHDVNAKYEGKQVDNIRINITNNQLVDDLIEIYEASFRLQNKGARAYEHELILEGKEAQLYKILENAKPFLEHMALQGLNHQSLCPCNSGKKFKVCHGKLINEIAKSI